MHEGRITSTTFRSEKCDLGFMLSNCFHVLTAHAGEIVEPIGNDRLRGKTAMPMISEEVLLRIKVCAPMPYV